MPTKRAISHMRFDKENTRKFTIKLNVHTDAELIAKLDAQSSKMGYIKQLIRADIEKEQKTGQ